MKYNKGFSLIELMVVLAILAIIAAIAYPAYARYTRRTACDMGKAGLVQAATLMNQYYMQYGSYKNPKTEGSEGFEVTKLPNDGKSGDGDFSVKVTDLQETAFTLTATPVSSGRLGGVGGSLTINEKNETAGTLSGIDVWSEGCNGM